MIYKFQNRDAKEHFNQGRTGKFPGIPVGQSTPIDAHIDPIFKELRIMKFRDICSLQMGQFV